MLKKAGFDNSPSFKNAVKYIIKKQNADGSWGVKNRNRPSKNLRTSLALNSLIISNSPHNKKRIEKGINWLLNTQKSDGSWDGGMFVGWPGKKEDIFTTTTVIRMLNKYRACLREENIENVF